MTPLILAVIFCFWLLITLPNGFTFFMFFSCISIIIYKFINKRNLRKKLAEKIAIQEKNYEEWYDTLKQEKKLIPIDSDLILKRKEYAFYSESSIDFYESRSSRIYQSGHAGFRIAKGIYIGKTAGNSRNVYNLTLIDSGELVLTNKRLIFDGSLEDRSILLKNIISTRAYCDSLEISVSNRKRSMFFSVNNPRIWNYLLTFLTESLEDGLEDLIDSNGIINFSSDN